MLAARTVAVVITFAAAARLQGQGTGRIAGVVRDETGAPVPGVELSVRPTDRRARTDSAGRFEVAQLPPRRYTVYARRLGFRPIEFDVRVRADSTSTLAVQLERRVYALDTVSITADCARFKMNGFYCRRRATGAKGEFLDERAIDSLDAGYWGTGDLFWNREGFRVRVDASGAHYPEAIAGWRCLVSLVNGRPPNRANPLPAKLDEVVGVEIYKEPGDIPSEYQSWGWIERQGRQPSRRCSMVIYWTTIRPR